MKLSVFGVGYVGLVTAACFAELGNEVLACDIDEKKIAALRAGVIPIYEPGLEEIVKRTVAAGLLKFTTDPAEASEFGEIIFVAVGTPSAEDGRPDMKYVHVVAGTIGEHLSAARKIIVMKSTVPVGTSGETRAILEEKLKARGADVAQLEFAVVSNPEFLKEGDAIRDFMKPDRVVVGVKEDWAKEKMAELYAPFSKDGYLVIFTDPASSEMSKYAANAMLASKISFMNQIAELCEAVGADVEEVRKAIAADTRIGQHFLYPGVGYGGSCFPKDVQALVALAHDKGVPVDMIEAVEAINERQKSRLVSRAKEILGDMAGKRIAMWGLAFKPNTDDMRAAPSISIIESLLASGAKVTAYDPVAMDEAKKTLGDRVDYAADMYECLKGADALFVVTEWTQFREPDFEKVAALLKTKNIFDGRNIYDPAKMRELGFAYVSVGRK
jgi:UDPglucose 6-dehydrogenase